MVHAVEPAHHGRSAQVGQRQEIFAVEDEIDARRDALIVAFEKRLHRASRSQPLFTIRWVVVYVSII
jgi:hypothetical protein